MAGAAIDQSDDLLHCIHPKLLTDRQAYRGILYGFRHSGRDLITAQVGRSYLLLPKSLEKKLKAHLEQSVEIARFGEKHYLRPFDIHEFDD